MPRVLLQDVDEQLAARSDPGAGARRACRARATARAGLRRSCRAGRRCCCISRKLSRMRARLALEQVLAARLQQRASRSGSARSAGRGADSGLRARNAPRRFCSRMVLSCVMALALPVVGLHQLLAGPSGRAWRRIAALGGEGISGNRTRCGPRAVRPGSAAELRRSCSAASWLRQAQRFAFLQQALRLRDRASGGRCLQAQRDPADHLQVAQAAGRLLQVRLQRVRRVSVLGVPLLLLQLLCLEEGGGLHPGPSLSPACGKGSRRPPEGAPRSARSRS